MVLHKNHALTVKGFIEAALIGRSELFCRRLSFLTFFSYSEINIIQSIEKV